MKENNKQCINFDRCNAYSGTSYLYSAISTENSPVFAAKNKGATEPGIPYDKKGGIIVFPHGFDPVLSDIEKAVNKHDFSGWTIGRFLKGSYTAKNGNVYSEDSLSLEITGVSDEALFETAEGLCRAFDQDSVLVKAYSERNRIFFCG